MQDESKVFRGAVEASNFTLLNEPRLAQLLSLPQAAPNLKNDEEIVRTLSRTRTDRANVDILQARIEKGPGFLNIERGQLSGGDASAAFEGKVYDSRNRMNISGTFLPGRGLNRSETGHLGTVSCEHHWHFKLAVDG